jgi:hypothetical protein
MVVVEHQSRWFAAYSDFPEIVTSGEELYGRIIVGTRDGPNVLGSESQ